MLKPADRLRHFADLDDLFDNNDNEIILKWVNELAERKLRETTYRRRHAFKQAEFVRVAKTLLQADELERVAQIVEEKMEEENEG